jgi:hypothetical protein
MELSKDERQTLAQGIETPFWEVVQKIALDSIGEFRDTLFKLNPQSPGYEAQALKLLMRAEVAQTVWEEMARRIEQELPLAKPPENDGSTPEKALPDVTEEMLV